jgi:Flp pilus assembly protein TadG
MAISPPSLARRLHRSYADRRGATAVEFAMVGMPFMFLIFAVIQVALYFVVQLTLDNATSLAARQLKTGQVQADGSNDTAGKQQFVTAICSNMNWLQSQCASNITVDVRPLGSGFNSAPSSQPMGSCYYSGSAGSAVELRSQYNWHTFTSFLASALQGGSGAGTTTVMSTEVFQVEPDGQTNASTTQC